MCWLMSVYQAGGHRFKLSRQHGHGEKARRAVLKNGPGVNEYPITIYFLCHTISSSVICRLQENIKSHSAMV